MYALIGWAALVAGIVENLHQKSGYHLNWSFCDILIAHIQTAIMIYCAARSGNIHISNHMLEGEHKIAATVSWNTDSQPEAHASLSICAIQCALRLRPWGRWYARCLCGVEGSPLQWFLTLKYPTLKRRTDSLSRRERISSEKGRRSVSRSSSPFRRSRWRLDGLDLGTSLPWDGFFLGRKHKKSCCNHLLCFWEIKWNEDEHLQKQLANKNPITGDCDRRKYIFITVSLMSSRLKVQTCHMRVCSTELGTTALFQGFSESHFSWREKCFRVG